MEEAISILVVDDEPDIRRICRILLETGGYTVLEAATGVEAVETVRQHPVVFHSPGSVSDREDAGGRQAPRV